jgi:hypothetical protein
MIVSSKDVHIVVYVVVTVADSLRLLILNEGSSESSSEKLNIRRMKQNLKTLTLTSTRYLGLKI